MRSSRMPLVFISIALVSMGGCSSAEVNDTMKSLDQSVSEFLKGRDTSVTPENRNTFEQVPFEKATNRAFYESLKKKKLVFSAIYKGSVPNPGELRAVKGYVNLKMCDVNKKSICSDLILINQKDADSVFNIAENRTVRVYGTLAEPSGIGPVNFKANNMEAPTIFFEVYKIE